MLIIGMLLNGCILQTHRLESGGPPPGETAPGESPQAEPVDECEGIADKAERDKCYLGVARDSEGGDSSLCANMDTFQGTSATSTPE